MTVNLHSSTLETIAGGMARAMFVSNYADAIDNGEIEGGKAGPGEDWMDVAPETPADYLCEAWRLIGKLEQANRMEPMNNQTYNAIERATPAERHALSCLALGRIFRLGSRPEQAGDLEQYESARAIVIACGEDQTNHTPNYARDRNRGAAGD